MEEIYQWMNQISEKYREVVTQHFLGMTYETRPLYYLQISQPSNNPKKIIWMDCGIHAREWIAPAFCQWFVKEILQNYKDNSRIRGFLKNLDFYVLPVLNIDGYIYTWTTVSASVFCFRKCAETTSDTPGTAFFHLPSYFPFLLYHLDLKKDSAAFPDEADLDRLWRKSRSAHNNGTCFGTDLNRNFNISWCTRAGPESTRDTLSRNDSTPVSPGLRSGRLLCGFLCISGTGASQNCEDITFCGTGPASEPETQAVSSLIESQKENVVCFLTIHSYGQLILTPYGYTTNKSSNHEELIQVGQKAANALKAKHGTNYRVGASADILYATSGSSKDWAHGIGIPFSYTVELRDNGTFGFILPETQIQATCEETMEAILSTVDDVYAKYWSSNSAGKVTSTAVVLSLLTSFTSLL
ncbi:hypothetical protein HPG69_004625 [Diceros bicornis minor]|uniref:Peptidase M14 domain-containing protein n=1 Tax=Diceros bicornis minor TaxID=77932 RepID=A0A7J7E434_DICBM|nr:hypothetical protein HPG69_004625 [Diceros bicornis minor]